MPDSKGELKPEEDGFLTERGDYVPLKEQRKIPFELKYIRDLRAALSTAEQRIEELEKEVDDLKTMYKSPYEMMARLRAEREKELREAWEDGHQCGRTWETAPIDETKDVQFAAFLASQKEGK